MQRLGMVARIPIFEYLGFRRGSTRSLGTKTTRKSTSEPDHTLKSTQCPNSPCHIPLFPFEEEPYQYINPFEVEQDPVQPDNHPPEYSPCQAGSNLDSVAAGEPLHSEHSSEDPGLIQDQPQELPRPNISSQNAEHAPEALPELDIIVAKDKLINQQRDVSAKRLQVRETRLALRYKREDEIKLRVNLMKNLNSLFVSHNFSGSEIMQDFELLQVTTQEYLSMEHRYHQEEDLLEEQEYLLTESMESFAESSSGNPSQDAQELIGSSTQDPYSPIQDTPPCVVNYLSRIGDERILQERLSDMESEWFLANEKREQWRYLQMELDEGSEEFLRTFDCQWRRVWKDLNIVQLDVNQLRIICLEHGHKDFDYEDLNSLRLYQEEPEMFSTLDETDPLKLPEDELFLFDDKSMEPNEDPGHFSPIMEHMEQPNKSLTKTDFFFGELENTGSFGNIEYVNKWMLHQLRISSLGIWQLQLLLDWQPRRDDGWQDRDIRKHAFNTWLVDGAGATLSASTSYSNDSMSRRVSEVAASENKASNPV